MEPVKRGRGRPRKGSETLGPRRTLRFMASEDREIEAALAAAQVEFSEAARPMVMEGMRKIIQKVRKR